MVKKHQIGLFIKTADTYKRIKKSTSLTISMNPETETFDFIADESPSEELKTYKPTIDQDLAMYKEEEDYKLIWPYFYEQKTGSQAHVATMIVFMQEPESGGGYKAWETDSVLSVQDLNAVDGKLNFQLLFGGTTKKGSATVSEAGVVTFTESKPSGV
ncbi:hypothetical protein ACTQ6A_14255 [Lachnospiraceae bacterium LCP25S3_G4]